MLRPRLDLLGALRVARVDRLHPLAAFLDGGIGQADDVQPGQARRDIDLDPDQLTAQAVDDSSYERCQHMADRGAGRFARAQPRLTCGLQRREMAPPAGTGHAIGRRSLGGRREMRQVALHVLHHPAAVGGVHFTGLPEGSPFDSTITGDGIVMKRFGADIQTIHVTGICGTAMATFAALLSDDGRPLTTWVLSSRVYARPSAVAMRRGMTTASRHRGALELAPCCLLLIALSDTAPSDLRSVAG